MSIQINTEIGNVEEVSKITSLNKLTLHGTNLHGNMIDFSELTNLAYLNLSGNTLWSEDLEPLKALRNNKNLELYLQNNAIIDASALLELDTSTKIYLSGNPNLSEDSKTKLKARFGNNVSF